MSVLHGISPNTYPLTSSLAAKHFDVRKLQLVSNLEYQTTRVTMIRTVRLVFLGQWLGQGIHAEFWWRNLLKDVHLQGREMEEH